VARSFARIIDDVNRMEKKELEPIARTSTAQR
jgi:hypothetical protein